MTGKNSLPPPRSDQASQEGKSSLPFADAEVIVRLYRRLVLLVGLQLALAVVRGLMRVPLEQTSPSSAEGCLWVLVNLVLLGSLIAIAVTTYKLMRRLGESLPILWAVAMFLPCANIVGLLVVSSRAQKWCKENGFKVGFFGPTKKSIEEVRQKSVLSTFE